MNEAIRSEPVCDRMQKHVALDEAIKNIYQIKHHADDMLNKISNGNNELKSISDSSPNKPSIPSLEQVLNDGPDRIRKTCEEVHSVLEQINQTLF